MRGTFRKWQQASDSKVDDEEYKYQPLSHARSIRLLKIHSGRGDIFCSLKETGKKTLAYDALSYTWGNAISSDETSTQLTDKRFIYCNNKRLQVTHNLFDALYQFRTRRPRRYLWVDAVCID